MKISTQTDVFAKVYGDEKTVELLAGAGFDAIDWTMFGHGSSILAHSDEEVIEHFTKLRKIVDSSGVYINQTHAPFPSAVFDPERDAKIFETIRRAIMASSILGARNIIIHPIIMRENRYNSLSAENKAINVEFYSRLIPYLEQYGVKAAIENMFNHDPEKNIICPTVCSYSTEMADYCDTMNSLCKNGDCFVNCLDIGHTTLSGEASLGDMVRTLGGRLKALHVHDNDGIRDMHTAPGFGGKVDYADFCTALAEIGYDGEFTFEADCFYRCFDADLLPDAAAILCKIGRALCEKYGL